jgi:hypothetical protein
MSPFYSPVKQLAALRLRLNRAQGKLKFATRRGLRQLALNAVFAIEAIEGAIEYIKSCLTPAEIIKMIPASEWVSQFNFDSCVDKSVHPTFEAYLESLNLPLLTLLSKDSQLTKIAETIRKNFVRDSLYVKLLHDSSYRLLTFALVVLKFKQFTSVEYWLKNQKQDYAIRADLNQAVSERLKSYPIPLYEIGIFASDTVECWMEGLSRQRRCQPGVDFANLENNFFCQNRNALKWEVWHYL